MTLNNAKDLERLICSMLKYFRGVEKIVVLSSGALYGYDGRLPSPKEGPGKAMTKLFELPDLKQICFLDESGATNFQIVVEKMLEGNGGEEAREKSILVKVVEKTLAEGDDER